MTLCQMAQAGGTDAAAYNVGAGADTLPELPRGTTMQQVRVRMGQPLHVHAAVGDPPITRWDYRGYVLYFERNLLLDIVVPNKPVPLVHEDQLH